jgi:integrase
MATISIEQVVGKKAVKYKARVRLTSRGKKIFEQSKTFEKEAQAKSWAKKLTKKLDLEGIPAKESQKRTILIGNLITMYLEDPITATDIGRSKEAVLKSLKNYDLALVRADELSANDLVEHCRQRIHEPNSPKPQTVYHDITYLKSVINVTGPMFNFEANTRAHDDAIPSLIKYGLIARSAQRTRRPTAEELEIMEAGLLKRQSNRASTIPLVDIYNSSLLTCMRRGEITRVVWHDFNEEEGTLTIRDRKDPRNKKGNHCTIPLCQEAIKIIKRQPRDSKDGRIFPHSSQSIGTAWQCVCKKNGIEDLHYHDLRAEAACRLYESGMSLVEISKRTGHRDLNVLNNIYLRLNVKGAQTALK